MCLIINLRWVKLNLYFMKQKIISLFFIHLLVVIMAILTHFVFFKQNYSFLIIVLWLFIIVIVVTV